MQAPLIDGDRFDMNFGTASPEESARLAKVAEATAIPELDPLYGAGGPLPRIWREASSSRSRVASLGPGSIRSRL